MSALKYTFGEHRILADQLFKKIVDPTSIFKTDHAVSHYDPVSGLSKVSSSCDILSKDQSMLLLDYTGQHVRSLFEGRLSDYLGDLESLNSDFRKLMQVFRALPQKERDCLYAGGTVFGVGKICVARPNPALN